MNFIKKYTSLLLVLLVVIGLAACKDNSGEDNTKDTMTISEVLEADLDETVTFTGIVVGYGDGNYLSRGVAYVYSPEEDKSIYLFGVNSKATPKVGQKITVTGTRDEYGGLPQVTGYDFEVVEENIDVAQYYTTVTVQDIMDNPGDPITQEGYLLKPVKLESVVISGRPNSNGTTYFTDATGTIGVYRFGYIINSNVEYGDVVDLYANVTAYDFGGDNQSLQLHSTYSNSFQTLEAVTGLTDQEKVDFAEMALYLPNETLESLNLPTSAAGATIAWVSSNESVIATDGTVTRPAIGADDETVTLTATITSGSVSTEIEFDVLVKADVNSMTVAEALDEADDTIVQVEAIVAANSGYGYLIYGDDGAYGFVYTGDPGLQTVGAKIKLLATMSTYNGLRQFTNTSILETLSENNTIPAPPVGTVADLEARTETAAIITATVSVEGQYNTVYLTDGNGDKVEVYWKSTPDYEADNSVLADYDGETITLPVVMYQDGKVLFIGDADDIASANLTDAEKVTQTKNSLTVPTTITDTLDLPFTLNGVTIEWTSNNDAIVIDNTNQTITVVQPAVGEADAAVELTANLSLNDEADSTTFTVTVEAQEQAAVLTIAEALATNTGEEVVVEGIITAYDYKAFFIQDGTGGIYVYGGNNITGIDSSWVGKTVQITGLMDAYKGLTQIKPATDADVIVVDDTTSRPEPIVVTDFTDMSQYEGQLIRLANVNTGTRTDNATQITDQSGNVIVTLYYGPQVGDQTNVDVIGVYYTRDDRGEAIVINSADDVLTVSTIAEALATTTGEVVIVEGIITAHDYKANFFIQDSTGGMYVYGGWNLTEIDSSWVGKTVRITGTMDAYKGMTQVEPATDADLIVLDDTTSRPEPIVVTDFTDMSQYEGKLIKLVDVNTGTRTDNETQITDQSGNVIVTLYYGPEVGDQTNVDVIGVYYTRDDRGAAIVINEASDVVATTPAS